MSKQVRGFQTEVSKLLNLLAKSLYSNKEVFLRELVSNASDAIDKLRFLSITQPQLIAQDPTFAIRIKADEAAGTLTISDNGIGMTLDQACEHLGTIAKSGTEEFFNGLSGDAQKDSQLIGQFGVGFYSAFIVADRVTVISRAAQAQADQAVRWESTGEGTYTSEIVTKDTRGTDIILHLKDDDKNFLDNWTLREAITKYSDHISTPVWVWEKQPEQNTSEDNDTIEAATYEWKQVNDARALWTLPPKDVTQEQYKAFYKHLTHDYEEPLTWTHNRVEGDLEYTNLLYVPKNAPWDLYTRDKAHGLKLFVQRIFIMDDAEQFLPHYLRFIRGLIDTNDLPLNVSRELLQESRVTQKLRKALTKRALDMLGKLAQDTDQYAAFWKQFGAVLKEGPVEDYGNRDTVLKLLRFASTQNDDAQESVSLLDYVSRMKDKQTKIYYLCAASYDAAKGSAYLETFKRKGIEVLLLGSRIDEWLMQNVHEFDGKQFVSVTSDDLQLGDLADEAEQKEHEQTAEQSKDLIERFKGALGDRVKDVRVSTRLIDSPSCIVAKQDEMMSAQWRRMLEAAGQPVPQEQYVLEINPKHPLIVKASQETDETRFGQWSELIFSQALLAEQGSLKDPNAFVKLLNTLMLH